MVYSYYSVLRTEYGVLCTSTEYTDCHYCRLDTPQLAQWYKATAEHPKVVKVLSGQSSYGPLNQYYINPE